MRQEINSPRAPEVRYDLQGMGLMRCKGRTFGECAKLTVGLWTCVELNMRHSGEGAKVGKGRDQVGLAGTKMGK